MVAADPERPEFHKRFAKHTKRNFSSNRKIFSGSAACRDGRQSKKVKCLEREGCVGLSYVRAVAQHFRSSACLAVPCPEAVKTVASSPYPETLFYGVVAHGCGARRLPALHLTLAGTHSTVVVSSVLPRHSAPLLVCLNIIIHPRISHRPMFSPNAELSFFDGAYCNPVNTVQIDSLESYIHEKCRESRERDYATIGGPVVSLLTGDHWTRSFSQSTEPYQHEHLKAKLHGTAKKYGIREKHCVFLFHGFTDVAEGTTLLELREAQKVFAFSFFHSRISFPVKACNLFEASLARRYGRMKASSRVSEMNRQQRAFSWLSLQQGCVAA
ncbi:uncharacterized protein CLUP02_05910 [Colletotrichum lupini]|uniref:Uncharacterized protein n=1 Tax=Colletotrichum lupini TaxID=145971 RepID=A0A9Q8SN50_9PEZI|nr:uncharacterized protein CLUP02_05910 [Colletotrichum lupini]UQC80427.1 hypothetical protein CLUP02_05910 [Colletotrichum lupini]